MRISLEETAKRLLQGDVVAIPTETVYGLAASMTCPEGIQKIYSTKGRPAQNPLIAHIASSLDIEKYAPVIPDDFNALGNAFWPGPVTLVIPIDETKIPTAVRAGLPTQAFRVPAHALTRELLKITGPLVAPSANPSGRPSAVSPEHVEADFGQDFPVLDGGVCQKGVESTILIFDDGRWRLGRLGAIAPESFESILGYVPEGQNKILCPGQLFRHYAPKAALQLGNLNSAPFILGFSDRTYPEGTEVIHWGESFNPEQVLSHLYEVLREMDLRGWDQVAVDIDFPTGGLWETLRERVKKASTNL